MRFSTKLWPVTTLYLFFLSLQCSANSKKGINSKMFAKVTNLEVLA